MAKELSIILENIKFSNIDSIMKNTLTGSFIFLQYIKIAKISNISFYNVSTYLN